MYKKIDLSGMDARISIERAKEFIDYRRIEKKKPLTQRAFDKNMKNAVSAATLLNCSPDKAIKSVMERNWEAVNPFYLLNAITSERLALAQAAENSERMSEVEMRRERRRSRQTQEELHHRSTRDLTLQEELNDTSWAKK